MVTLLEEIYCFEDIRPQLESRFKLQELMRLHGEKHKPKHADKLLQNAVNSQQMNNAKDF
jgi:hypothetical protein